MAEELQSLAEINVEDFQPGPQAVQAQLINSDGSFVDDFTFEFFQGDGITKRVINCKFLPSPAATCSLAIAEYVVSPFVVFAPASHQAPDAFQVDVARRQAEGVDEVFLGSHEWFVQNYQRCVVEKTSRVVLKMFDDFGYVPFF
ncbi:hypothetical protein NQ315_002145, partial [Exocentrus adspersus]